MTIILIIVHVLVCIALIMIVLLQTGKGADMGAAFGGGASNTLFGSSGPGGFLSKATTVAAIVFMLTSLALAYMSTHRAPSSIMSDAPAPVTAPATGETTAQPSDSQPATEAPASAPEQKQE